MLNTDLARAAVSESSPSACTGRFILVGLSGAAFGLAAAIGDGETIVGRSSACDLRIGDDQVSRRHVRLSLVPGEHPDGRSFVLIEDLASRNGLYINGHRTGRALLESGDEILIGRSVLRLDRVDDSDYVAVRQHVELRWMAME